MLKFKFNFSELVISDLAAAFDMVLDPVVALETLISLGFHRVLTSGCDTSALEGLPLIKRLVDQVSRTPQELRQAGGGQLESSAADIGICSKSCRSTRLTTATVV